MRIYVASSWRNKHQPGVVDELRQGGHEVYDFRNPEAGNRGFHWSEIECNWQEWSPASYVLALEHPIARAGYNLDFRAMCWADACVLVLPCGRSGHLEAGWFAGVGKTLIIYVPEPTEPELMYRMADRVCTDMAEVLTALQPAGVRVSAQPSPLPPDPPC